MTICGSGDRCRRGSFVTLWPAESQSLAATYAIGSFRGDIPVVSVTGSNIRPTTAAAGRP
jgi:hypothetical protein